MNIFAWIFRFAAGRFIAGIALIFLGFNGLNKPTLEKDGEVIIHSALWYFGKWPFVLCVAFGVALIAWAYIIAKKWRGR